MRDARRAPSSDPRLRSLCLSTGASSENIGIASFRGAIPKLDVRLSEQDLSRVSIGTSVPLPRATFHANH